MQNYGFHAYSSHIEAVCDRSSGRIILECDDDNGSKISNANAIPAPRLMTSSILKGLKKGSLASFLRDEESKMLVDAVCVCYLQRQQNQEPDKLGKAWFDYTIRHYIEASLHPEIVEGLSVEEIHNEVDRWIENELADKVVSEFCSSQYKHLGWEGLKTLTASIEKIETSLKNPTEEEYYFLDCVSQCASEICDVPTQKEVFNMWQDDNLRNSRDTFRGIRDRVGFKWLPAAKRGKKLLR